MKPKEQNTALNSLDSPRESSPPTKLRRVSFLRGLFYALPASVVGFAIPYVILCAIPLVDFACFGQPHYDLRIAVSDALGSAAGCSFVFALAAILNYTPARTIGFIRALLIVGLFTLLSFFITIALVPGQRTKTSDPFSAVRLTISMVIPVVLSFVALLYVIYNQSADRSCHNP